MRSARSGALHHHGLGVAAQRVLFVRARARRARGRSFGGFVEGRPRCRAAHCGVAAQPSCALVAGVSQVGPGVMVEGWCGGMGGWGGGYQ